MSGSRHVQSGKQAFRNVSTMILREYPPRPMPNQNGSRRHTREHFRFSLAKRGSAADVALELTCH
jgi:hypothetical protein